MIYIGIDPGINGAVGFLNASGELKEVIDIPTHEVEGKRRVDVLRLFNWLEGAIWRYAKGPTDIRLAIEKVHAMPNQGVTSCFNFGETLGRICACFEILEINDITYVRPQVWKKYFNLDRDKNTSLYLARDMFPKAELHLKKYSDRAEALLIARWLYEQ